MRTQPTLRAFSWVAALAFFAALGLAPIGATAQTGLKDRLDAKPGTNKKPAARTAEERTLNDSIRDFYAKRDFKPIWFGDAAATARTKVLIETLEHARDHGLSPSVYDMPKLAQSVEHATAANRDELEIELTIAFLNYAGDIISGTVSNPRRVGGTFRDAKRPDPKKLLDGLLAASDPAKYFDNLPPDTRRYTALKHALAHYRELEKKGGWGTVARGPTLKIGMRSPRVVEAKKRLLVTGDLAKMEGDPDLFDGALMLAVRKFQRRQGLVDDGNIGAATVAAMNVPIKDRIEQIIINLERRRWLAGYLGERYIYVNIADNDLKIVENGHTVFTARVVVGRPYHETPVFSAMMRYIEFNPYWNVPYKIATDELLPVIKRVPGYLQSNNYLVLTRMGDNNSAIDPARVDWAQYGPGNFPFYIRQKPGPRNALGTTLFMFPNPHNVFIHDTPIRSIFNLEDRYFSHGCVRVENPWRLALFLLKRDGDKDWTEERIRKVIEKRDPLRVNLKHPLPVHMTYLTAWAEADGTVNFRRDAYRRDAALRSAMSKVAYAGVH